jgi:hypothetical protein
MYIDDIRSPKKEYSVVIRSSQEAEDYLIRNGCPNHISFDHDLGGDDTAMNIVKFIINMDLDMNGDWVPEDFTWNIHSANPVGAANIDGYLTSYMTQKSSLCTILNECEKCEEWFD